MHEGHQCALFNSDANRVLVRFVIASVTYSNEETWS